MTAAAVEHWLRARQPGRPEALAGQMSRSLATCPAASLEAAPTVSSALGVLGLYVLAGVAEGPGESPQVALELLAADAFVTYAFEAAAEEGVSVAPFAGWLIREAA